MLYFIEEITIWSKAMLGKWFLCSIEKHYAKIYNAFKEKLLNVHGLFFRQLLFLRFRILYACVVQAVYYSKASYLLHPRKTKTCTLYSPCFAPHVESVNNSLKNSQSTTLGWKIDECMHVKRCLLPWKRLTWADWTLFFPPIQR